MAKTLLLFLTFLFGKAFSQSSGPTEKSNLLGHSELTEVLSGTAKIIYLDFESSPAISLDTRNLDSLVVNGNYTETKAKFRNDSFFIIIQMRRKTYEFRFDPTYSGSFLMTYDEDIPFLKKENHQTITGKSTDLVYNNKWITFSGINYSSAVTISDTVNRPKVGMGFIKGFNWIIDKKHRKVYFKKNNSNISSENDWIKSYRAGIENGKLVVVSRNEKFKKYNIGETIVSVNGNPVSPQTLTEIEAILSGTDNWQLLDIVTERKE